jgi:hypothetical protein
VKDPEPLPLEVNISGRMRELPKPLLYEIRTAYDEGIQFAFKKVVDLCDTCMLSTELHGANVQHEAFAFIKQWVEETMLEIAMDAPAADEEVSHEKLRDEERQR